MSTAWFLCRRNLRRAVRSTVKCALIFGLLTSLASGAMRTWVDSSGKHRVEAELVGVKGRDVVLRNSAGREITVPIARLSPGDQAFIRQQSAANPSTPTESSPTAAKPALAKPVAKRFYTALADQDLDQIKTLLTPAGQANWEGAKTLIEGLEPPDNRQSVLVRAAKPNADANMVDVNVNIKVRGKYLKQIVQLRWTNNQWLVASVIQEAAKEEDSTDDADGARTEPDEQAAAEPINFEGTADEAGGSQVARRNRAAPSDEDEDADQDEDSAADARDGGADEDGG